MGKESIKLQWDGETIKQHIDVPDRKFTPKEIIQSLEHARSQVKQMEDQLQQLDNNKRQIQKDIISATEFIKERSQFEKKCLELQAIKLQALVKTLTTELKAAALKEADEAIAKDPNAYTEDQKKNMKYVMFQRKLATHEKVANKIAPQVITHLLYEEPIFESPF